MNRLNDVIPERELLKLCSEQWTKLVEGFGEYELINSCNWRAGIDESAYLIPNGTKEEISYSSKPRHSFRISDHWSWRSNLSKNPNEGYVQCCNVSFPPAMRREEPGKAGKPWKGWCIAYTEDGYYYKTIFGAAYDRATNMWHVVNKDINLTDLRASISLDC